MTDSKDPAQSFSSVSPNQLHRLLEHNAQLITSNQRLSRYRMQQFESAKLSENKTSWPTPNILPWTAWIEQQWRNTKLGACLNASQEALLWQNTLAEDEQTEVLNPKALSKQAMEAWKILADFQINPDCLKDGGDEHRALWRWGSAVTGKSPHTFTHQVLEKLGTCINQPYPETLILDGFDTFTPAQLKYLSKLAAMGSSIHRVKPDYPEAEQTITAYRDDTSELRGICEKIRQSLSHKPDQSIAILVPNLEQRAQHVARILSEELAPELSLKLNHESQGEFFNLSLGSPLGKQPLVQTAFLLLSFIQKPYIQHDVFSTLLLNPYIAGFDEEQFERAALDKKLRASNQFILSLKQFSQFCTDTSTEQHFEVPQLQAILEQLYQLKESKLFQKKQPVSDWIVTIEQTLTLFSWQMQCTKPTDHAQLQGWKELTDRLTQLDDYCGPISWSEAISLLKEHALEQVFRPAPSQANIQVMGLLEAANLRFDEAYVISMDDLSWPPTAKPHPLIPFDIQALHQTPHANSEREWQYAQSVWSNLQQIAPSLHISYAKSINNQEVQLSSLIQSSVTGDACTPTSVRYTHTLQQQRSAMTQVMDTATPVADNEKISGGTGILKAEALCAFQAFAMYRLKLKELETPGNGLNAAEQGTLLHKALELFWKKIQTQQNLCNMDETSLSEGVQAAIQSSWSELQRYIPEQTKVLEERRLKELLLQWLSLESHRDPFKAVEFESWRNVTLGSKQKLTLHTKIDRIDEDAKGNRIIIDYKSGETSPSKAIGESLTEPQLPIYFMAEQQKQHGSQAIAFAQVKNGSMGFKGVALEKDILPGINAYKGRKDQPEDWDELTHSWQETLHTLADEFLEGAATISPKTSQSCHYCPFEGLCRIQLQETA